MNNSSNDSSESNDETTLKNCLCGKPFKGLTKYNIQVHIDNCARKIPEKNTTLDQFFLPRNRNPSSSPSSASSSPSSSPQINFYS